MRAPLPTGSENILVVRTHYSDDAAWRELRRLMTSPAELFPPEQDFLQLRTVPVDPAWEHTKQGLAQYRAEQHENIEAVDDPSWEGASAAEVRAALADSELCVAFLADAVTMAAPGRWPMLAVDLTPADGEEGEPGEFRLHPDMLHYIHVNMEVGNMYFSDYEYATADAPVRFGDLAPPRG
ncbi:DUF6924 domain-containing protein [Marinactinospora rubrisoli]|uniref:DUF6924 domain-containing protein n=1 Tax=Marinactinospora rubrisoli TaxID=2715399 RepID=A0ABW2KLS7_9ACTN